MPGHAMLFDEYSIVIANWFLARARAARIGVGAVIDAYHAVVAVRMGSRGSKPQREPPTHDTGTPPRIPERCVHEVPRAGDPARVQPVTEDCADSDRLLRPHAAWHHWS